MGLVLSFSLGSALPHMLVLGLCPCEESLVHLGDVVLGLTAPEGPKRSSCQGPMWNLPIREMFMNHTQGGFPG